MDHQDEIPVSASDIAELLQLKSKSTVTNWSRRFAEGSGAFPKPLGHGGTSPLYDWREVRQWLLDRDDDKVAPRMATIRDRDVALLGAYNRLRDLEPSVLERVVSAMAAAWLAVLRAGGRRESALFASCVAGESDAFSSWRFDEPVGAEAFQFVMGEARQLVPAAGLAKFAEAVAAIPTETLAAEVDRLQERIGASKGRSGESYGYVDSRISQIFGSLAAARTPKVLYDPTAGIGAGALKAWDALSKAGRPQRIVLHDIEPKALQIASERGLLRGAPVSTAHANILKEDPEPDLQADVVVCETPFGVMFDGSPLDPRWSGMVQGKGSADLAWLGHAITHLAPKGRAYVVTGTAALFRAPDASGRAALLERGVVEAVVSLPAKMLRYTSTATALWVLCPAGESAWPGQVLVIDATAVDPNSVDVLHWLAGRGEVGSRPVSVSEAVRSGADLNPLRWVPESASAAVGSGVEAVRHRAVGSDFDNARADLDARLAEVGGATKDLALQFGADGVAVHTVAALLDWGILSIGRRRTTSPEALEVRDTAQLSPEYFQLMLTGPWNEHVWASKSDGPSLWTRVEIPLVPIEQQVEIVASHDRIAAIESDLREAARRTSALGSAYLDLVRYGRERGSDPR